MLSVLMTLNPFLYLNLFVCFLACMFVCLEDIFPIEQLGAIEGNSRRFLYCVQQQLGQINHL